jgi:hypothetical protein
LEGANSKFILPASTFQVSIALKDLRVRCKTESVRAIDFHACVNPFMGQGLHLGWSCSKVASYETSCGNFCCFHVWSFGDSLQDFFGYLGPTDNGKVM